MSKDAFNAATPEQIDARIAVAAERIARAAERIAAAVESLTFTIDDASRLASRAVRSLENGNRGGK